MNLSKIVVGVDLSAESLLAVDHAMILARRAGASIVLLHVANVPATMHARPDDPLAALQRERLRADRDDLEALRVRRSGQGVELSQLIVDGDPDVALADAARELGADLIVVGTHGRTGVRRIALGSVAEKTIRLAASSVLVVRGPAPPGGYRQVVAGSDYSEAADGAVASAIAMAAPGGEVRLVHAWSAPYLEYDLTGRMIEALRQAEEQIAGEQLRRMRSWPRPADVDLTLDVTYGVPFVVLDGYVDADLIVVGTHGRRGVRRFLIGSVAESTVRHARCTVLVTR